MTTINHIRATMRNVLINADATTVRLLLANASFLWTVGLLLDPHMFERPAYAIMGAMFNAYTWALLFFLHGLGVHWRLFDRVSRPRWAVAVNTLGFFLWLTSTLSINIALGRFLTSSALEFVLCVASAWALFRTGLTDEAKRP